MSQFDDVRELVTRWSARTEELLKQSITEQDAISTDDLRKTLRQRVDQVGDGVLRALFEFKSYGRFVDMGAGRQAKFETAAGNRRAAQKRKAKKWYSPVFYSRLAALRGAIGYKIVEQAISSISQKLKD